MFIRTESFKEFIRYYPVVTGIVLIHITLYILSVLPFFPNSWLIEQFAGVNIYIVEGEIWRLFTPIFMHSGFAHMLFNSFSLVLFGPTLEQMFGKVRFISLYLATGIIANVATLVLKPLTYVHVGSSGAIFGLFGIYIAMVLFRRDLMSRENSQIILTIAVIGLIMTFIQPNINVTAHLFGFISGFIVGSITLGRGKEMTQTFTRISRRAVIGASSSGKPFSKMTLIWGAIALLALIGLLSR